MRPPQSVAPELGILQFRALFLAMLLIAAGVQTNSDRFEAQLRHESLTRDFPDAELVRRTDPPQSFNFETKRWSEWPSARFVITPEVIPAIPRRIKRK